MAKVDDYQMSFDISAEKLANRNLIEVAKRAGAKADEDGKALELTYYGRPVRVERDPWSVHALDEGPEIPLPEQALILHYLETAEDKPLANEWITYREVPSGEFYWSAFVRRAKQPLVGFFGERPQYLLEMAPKVGGEPIEGVNADAAVVVWAFPKVPILFQLWAGDDEFPADGNVLFDKTVAGFLPTEDIALVAGLPIYKIMAMSRG
ncbi:DUF3786 domain-containing protein [Dethiosulfatarculus sandiegensis]|uniref:DUF3786 domain-containing protein n=1 Tax=Dethiosulfatarculus sandiegensis TaxID=1429043 RepID=A0A0D2JYE7_9BACT|nr:DUF3786 domain-containing protein [Dethiosulfatarculus sandiegensis]KIX14555.1 hypothetical protein X474_08150 [Dethiosulfatarculus sandiegensis]